MEIRNKKLTDEEFFQERRQVLTQWPTGKAVDLDEAIAYHKNLPPGKVFSKKLAQAKRTGDVYAITGMGKATIEEQIELLKYVESEGQAELLGTSPDSFGRICNFALAEKELKESLKIGKSTLNGVPIVNHGVIGIRKIMESVSLPVQMRYAAIDPRLIEEIAIAGGHTATCGDGIYSFWNMNSKLPIETILSNYRYVHRLVAYYEQKGAPISLSTQGIYGGGTLPPSLVAAAMLTQVLTMAEQGVKNIHLHYHARGNLIQDIAGANVLCKLAQEYLEKFGHQDVAITLATALALFKYPMEIGSAFGIICINSIAAILCGAQVNDIRTTSEAITIPTKEDTATSFRCAKIVTNLLKGQRIAISSKTIAIEAEREELETRIITDRVLDLGEGDVIIGTIRAIQLGVLDNPFATNSMVACKVMGVKDNEGAIRYLDVGNLPFTKDILEFHKGKIAEREKKLGREIDYETIVHDISSISKGYLVA